MKEEMNKKGWFFSFLRKYSYVVFFIFIVGVTALIILTQVDPVTWVTIIKEAKPVFLLLGIICIFIYWLLEAFMLLRLMKQENPKEKFSFAFTLMMVGQYYNLLDPSSSGGQPLQLYEMSKKGYGLGLGTAVLVKKYALYQVTITFLAIAATIFSIAELHHSLDAAKWLIVIGLILNVAAVILIFILIYNPKAAKKILLGCVKLLLKLRILRDPEKYYRKVDHFLGEYKIAIKSLASEKWETFQLFSISIIQMIIFYSVNYCVYLSLGLSGTNAITIISLQAILYVAVAFIPTPGAAGGAEAGFLLIFGPIYGAGNAPIAMILWRIISFYFILLFGAAYLSIHSIKMGKDKAKHIGEELSHSVDHLIEENEKSSETSKN